MIVANVTERTKWLVRGRVIKNLVFRNGWNEVNRGKNIVHGTSSTTMGETSESFIFKKVRYSISGYFWWFSCHQTTRRLDGVRGLGGVAALI